MEIVKYTRDHGTEWDAFIDASKNGTFLLKRDYMDYHSDRFTDCSHLFYDKNKLIAVLPANINVEEQILYSHQGLTYGGLIMKKDITAVQVLEIFEAFLPFARKNYNVKKLVYKTIPHIYCRYPAEEDLYALFRNGAVLQRRLLSSVIDKKDAIPFSRVRKRHINCALKAGMKVNSSTDFTAFWSVLNNRLFSKYQAVPVHSQNEIEHLYSLFPNQIQLFEARIGEDIFGGCVVFVMNDLVHIQYSSATESGMELGALDLLFHHIACEAYNEKRYIDIGTSNEQDGRVLNENLIFRKETCGARAVVLDTYELNLI